MRSDHFPNNIKQATKPTTVRCSGEGTAANEDMSEGLMTWSYHPCSPRLNTTVHGSRDVISQPSWLLGCLADVISLTSRQQELLQELFEPYSRPQRLHE